MPTSRAVSRTLPARPGLGGVLMRMVGSLDCRGQGTEFPLAELGPFLLIEDARGIDGPDQPPFGPHPHAGLAALSYIAGDGPWRSHANAVGSERVDFGGGDVLLTFAGRGVVHDERSVGDGAHLMTQIIVRLPRARASAAGFVRKLAPTRVDEHVLRLFDDDALSDVGVRATGFHARLPAGVRTELAVDPAHRAALVFAREGAVRVAGAELASGDVAVLEEEGDVVSLAAPADAAADCLVFAGAPIDEPWAKLLGNNGFVVGEDEAHVDELMARFERERDAFGRDR